MYMSFLITSTVKIKYYTNKPDFRLFALNLETPFKITTLKKKYLPLSYPVIN